MTRYKATIEYLGTNYAGFQVQKKLKTVASCLNKAIEAFTHEQVNVIASGRTDAGVHALEQVIHFDLTREFTPYKIISATNYHLRGENVSLTDCEIVPDNFDSRHNAKARYYEYHILNRKTRPAVFRNLTHWVREDLDEKLMHKAAQYLVGEHDFSSFRDSECQAKHAFRYIEHIKISRTDECITIAIKGNAFLHHMVRIIAGTLIEIGKGKWPVNKMPEILAAKDRIKAGPTAAASGLFLTRIIY